MGEMFSLINYKSKPGLIIMVNCNNYLFSTTALQLFTEFIYLPILLLVDESQSMKVTFKIVFFHSNLIRKMLHTLILQYHQDLNHPTPSLCRLLIKVVERYIGIPLFEKIEDAKRSREPPYTKTKLLSVVCEGWW